MATKLHCNPFELMAFEAAVSSHPTDSTAALALRDYLQDHGYTFMGARIRVAKLVREATEQAQCDKVKRIFAAAPLLHDRVIRSLMGRSRFPAVPVPTLRVLPRQFSPAYCSGPGFYRDRDGNQYSAGSPPLEYVSELRWVPAWARYELSAANVLAIIEELTGDRHET